MYINIYWMCWHYVRCLWSWYPEDELISLALCFYVNSHQMVCRESWSTILASVFIAAISR